MDNRHITNGTATDQELSSYIQEGARFVNAKLLTFNEYSKGISHLYEIYGTSRIDRIIYDISRVKDELQKYIGQRALTKYLPLNHKIIPEIIDDLSEDQGEANMRGHEYVQRNNYAPKHYTHMRYMLKYLWNAAHVMPGHRFEPDLRFKRDAVAISDYLLAHFSADQLDNAHLAVISEIKYRGRGRPPGALNKNRFNQPSPQQDDDGADPFGVDEQSEGKADLPSANAVGTPVLENGADKPIANFDPALLAKYALKTELINGLNKVIDVTNDNIEVSAKNTFKLLEAYVNIKVKELDLKTPRVIHIYKPDAVEPIDIGIQHYCFPTLLKKCNSRTPDGHRLNIWLYGPAGTGKSTAAYFVAKALGLDFYTLGALESGFQILGYNDAHGVYQSTQFRKAFEFGGIIMLDEQDSYSPSASLALNAALASGWCAFGDGKLIHRHKDCVVIAGANTTGLGGTMEYSGRAKQDAAFLNRFIKQYWPIDEALEDHLCQIKPWLAIVRHCRRRVMEIQLKNVMVTPRATLYGCSLLRAGLTLDETIDATIKSGMTDAQWGQIAPPYDLLTTPMV
jgi:ATPase family associated with various cellular activities (AAA)